MPFRRSRCGSNLSARLQLEGVEKTPLATASRHKLSLSPVLSAPDAQLDAVAVSKCIGETASSPTSSGCGRVRVRIPQKPMAICTSKGEGNRFNPAASPIGQSGAGSMTLGSWRRKAEAEGGPIDSNPPQACNQVRDILDGLWSSSKVL